MSTTLPAISVASKAVAPITSPRGLPDPVKTGIRTMLVAFPSQNVSTEERTMQLGVYAAAVSGFEEELVLHELKHLCLHNPRNTPTYTQPPTAQDVYEAMGKRRRAWAQEAKDHFIGSMRFKTSGYSWICTRDLPCSRDLAEKLFLESFDRNDGEAQKLIVEMPQDAFDNLPDRLLADGWREIYEEERSFRAYMRSLTDEGWQVRRAVLLDDRFHRSNDQDVGPDLTEDAVMARVKTLLEEHHAARESSAPESSYVNRLEDFLRAKKLFFTRETYGIHAHDLRCVPWSVLNAPTMASPQSKSEI